MPERGPRRSLAACAAICAASTLVAVVPAPFAQASTAAGHGRGPAPVVSAAAGMMVNAKTGKELWGLNQSIERSIASLTKVMTALVVIRAGDLGRRIMITWAEVNYVQTYGASNAGLQAGDFFTARQLLNAMLLPSGADAAMALAISYGPGIPKFVRKMNALARRLHMTRSHFTNFDGLQSTDVSTPSDLIKLGRAAMRERAFRSEVRRKRYRLHAWSGHHHRYLWLNTNLLLKRYPGVTGIKTGWTPPAGECLLFEATHRKKVMIGVVLDSAPTNEGVTFVDAAKLLNWAFGLNVPIPPPMPPPVRPTFSLGG
ncbi:MAG TPA: D-alanyl-D-alanine carboxypeptidase [Streptosporangiaceae bacterium]|nr:D-alanyl-D-alanine carboxypeptidase [Streptosporangiaceae bacterium]